MFWMKKSIAWDLYERQCERIAEIERKWACASGLHYWEVANEIELKPSSNFGGLGYYSIKTPTGKLLIQCMHCKSPLPENKYAITKEKKPKKQTA